MQRGERLLSDKLPRIVNLAHAAGSPITGMQLVADARAAPYCVLVEANLGYKRADLEHLELFQNPFALTMKQHILNTLHENQPLNMMLSFVKTLRNSFTKKPPLLRQIQFQLKTRK